MWANSASIFDENFNKLEISDENHRFFKRKFYAFSEGFS
jgi:hypothetical protein